MQLTTRKTLDRAFTASGMLALGLLVVVLLLLLGSLFGLAVDLARDGQERLEAVLAERERLRERERLSRAVHDGVLQALAYIHRRGSEIGGESA